MPELRIDDTQLAVALADLGTLIDFPAVPDVRARVQARIAEPRRMPWWGAFARARYPLAPVLLTAVVMIIAVLVFSPQARATAADILRLRGVEIFRGPLPSPTPTPTPGPTPSPSLALGQPVTLDEARQRAGYAVLVPADAALGAPDEVYLRPTAGSMQVSFVYRSRPPIPLSAQAGVSAVVSEFGNATVQSSFFGKLVGPDTKLENVTVNGGNGFWLEGKPHGFFYQERGSSTVTDEPLRLAGNTLLWEQNGMILRIEAQVDKATALRIAASFK
ncbi:MAG TPA: hypothetical protein VHG53_05275 [Candidatus Limnocylindria bacterium]|nr:hypothetical protein [Candidatus Limnocylindria bacterium]